jgi:hypothetical protein
MREAMRQKERRRSNDRIRPHALAKPHWQTTSLAETGRGLIFTCLLAAFLLERSAQKIARVSCTACLHDDPHLTAQSTTVYIHTIRVSNQYIMGVEGIEIGWR